MLLEVKDVTEREPCLILIIRSSSFIGARSLPRQRLCVTLASEEIKKLGTR